MFVAFLPCSGPDVPPLSFKYYVIRIGLPKKCCRLNNRVLYSDYDLGTMTIIKVAIAQRPNFILFKLDFIPVSRGY